ncbi:MAG: hypothetical protein R6W93_05125 [Candidatus Limnocylindrales bacterium]
MSHGVLREFDFDDALVRGDDALVDACDERRPFRLAPLRPSCLEFAQEAHDTVRVGHGRHRVRLMEAVELRGQAGVFGEVGLGRHPSGSVVRCALREIPLDDTSAQRRVGRDGLTRTLAEPGDGRVVQPQL